MAQDHRRGRAKGMGVGGLTETRWGKEALGQVE